jgi:hypothetical protein
MNKLKLILTEFWDILMLSLTALLLMSSLLLLTLSRSLRTAAYAIPMPSDILDSYLDMFMPSHQVKTGRSWLLTKSLESCVSLESRLTNSVNTMYLGE